MLIELQKNSQITIPREIIDKTGLAEGNQLEIFEKDGMIGLRPVSVYPENYLSELKMDVEEMKGRIASGEQPVFDRVDTLFEHLDIES